jgi:hypothetical protein
MVEVLVADMTHTIRVKASRTNSQAPTRAWQLSLLATFAGLAAVGLAVICDGPPRAAFDSVAIVLLVTAFFCDGFTSLESHNGPPFDPDELPVEPPVPQSQVTLIYDPIEAPNNILERDSKPRDSGRRRRVSE